MSRAEFLSLLCKEQRSLFFIQHPVRLFSSPSDLTDSDTALNIIYILFFLSHCIYLIFLHTFDTLFPLHRIYYCLICKIFSTHTLCSHDVSLSVWHRYNMIDSLRFHWSTCCSFTFSCHKVIWAHELLIPHQHRYLDYSFCFCGTLTVKRYSLTFGKYNYS